MISSRRFVAVLITFLSCQTLIILYMLDDDQNQTTNNLISPDEFDLFVEEEDSQEEDSQKEGDSEESTTAYEWMMDDAAGSSSLLDSPAGHASILHSHGVDNTSTTSSSNFQYDDLNSTTTFHASQKKKIMTTTTTTTRGDQHHHKFRLPDLRNGGIVLFFHVPKTGGTSIRFLAHENDKIELHGNKSLSMPEIRDMVTKWSTATSSNRSSNDRDPAAMFGPSPSGGKVKFLEFHWNYDPFYEMIGDIRTWRKNAKMNNIPFFVFTVLRNPLETYISTFNYFCIYSHKRRDVDCPPPFNADKMLAISRDNTQSRYLCYATILNIGGSRSHLDATKNKSIEEGCGDIVKLVGENMDWVGIQSELRITLGVFLSMGIDLGFVRKNKVGRFQRITSKKLNQTTIDMVWSRLSEDRRLFNWAKETYTLANFGVDPQIVKKVEKFSVKKEREKQKQNS